MSFYVRFEGGAYDGAAGVCDRAPERLWVLSMNEHGEVTASASASRGGEPYVEADRDQRLKTVRYVYEDLNVEPWTVLAREPVVSGQAARTEGR